jgi:anti-sigma factor RsiW
MSGRGGHAGDLLAALVDGRLTEPDRQRVIDHLTQCPRCLAEYDAQLALKGVLASLPDPDAPDDLRELLVRVPARGPSRPAGPHGPLRPARTRRARATRRGTAVLTAGAAVFAGAYLLGGAPPGQAVVPPIDRYVRQHAAVSVNVPLTQPMLSQLVVQPGPYQLPPVSSATASGPAQPTASRAALTR